MEDRRSLLRPHYKDPVDKRTREGVDGVWAVLSSVVLAILLFYGRSENHSLKLARIC